MAGGHTQSGIHRRRACGRFVLGLALVGAPLFLKGQRDAAAVVSANPSNYLEVLRGLRPGDHLTLDPGTYPGLPINNLNGSPDAWITVSGPSSGGEAVIAGSPGRNTVEIWDSSYVSVEELRIDSRGIPGAFGISAKGHEENRTHHIRVENNTLVGQNGSQQTDGISTKTATWGWTIRYNRILGAGTGIYLGESDGTQPFVAGVIENNLIQNTTGYDMEIKDQRFLPSVPGMPLGPTSTIIRNNVFIKDDRPSPDGDRPNLLVGAFPPGGPGSLNLYEIYGNFFLHNSREALLQASGRVSIHDNIFADGPFTYPAVVLRKQNFPLQIAHVYNNTVFTPGGGIHFGSRALIEDAVVGNLVFATKPISGPILLKVDNIEGLPGDAAHSMNGPSFAGGPLDFYPLPGKCQGAPLDLSWFHSETDYTLDFNGVPKTAAKGAVVFRGAYAGEGPHTGWALSAAVKPPWPPRPKPPLSLVWIEPATGTAGRTVAVKLYGANFTREMVPSVSGEGIAVSGVEVASATEIDVQLKISSGASGYRAITVGAPLGRSNEVRFRINPRRPVGER
ncbi:MAG TPA: hypothetical protein VJ732_09830 [Bryobacteraceae bacterium]|nr:hypothetical protein [Bryobacteraceae bacterium]